MFGIQFASPAGLGGRAERALGYRAVMPRSLGRRLLFALLACILVLVGLEVAARALVQTTLALSLPPEVREWVAANKLVFDPVLGWRSADREVIIDGAAFKESELLADRVPRAPGELRGYALGDSQTHGAGIAEEQAWPHATQAYLRAAGHEVTVINLGSSGYRSAQVLQVIEHRLLALEPDFLIVDCMARDSDPVERDPGPRVDGLRQVLFESRLYRLLRLGVAATRGENLGATEHRVRVVQPPGGPAGEGNHQAIADLAAEAGIPLVFVDYPFTGTPIRQLAPPAQLPRGVPVVLATEALSASGHRERELFLDGNHLTATGSTIVGEAVAKTLADVLGLPLPE